MNFDDTPQEAEFRATAKAWIGANAPKQYEEELRKSSLGRTQLTGANILEVAKVWQKKKADAGWACLHWPKEYGGRGATPSERVIWQQEEGAFGKLSGMFIIGHGMCGPTMMAFAGEDQKRKYLPPLASGEKVWCQLFSEPAGGADRRRPPPARGETRRRLDHQRPEDLDLRRALFRLWHPAYPYRSQCAQAQGTHDVLSRHEEPGRRDQADQAGQRPVPFQCSVFYRCENSGCAAARRRQRWLERVADHADERADVDRRRCFDRFPGAVRVLQQSDAGR